MAGKQTTLSSFFGGGRQPKEPEGKAKRKASEKDDSNSTSDKEKTVEKKRVKRFNDDWYSEFRWLRTENDDKSGTFMYCRICESAGKLNGFTRGCINLQKSALKDHRDSDSHREAVLAMSHKTAMDTHVSVVKDKNDECLVAMMRTVLYMARENLPTSKFSSLVDLQRRNGCTSLSGVVYSHPNSVEQLEEALVMSTADSLKQKISTSNFVGLIMDETVNVTVEKKLILFLRIVSNGKYQTVFLGNYSVHSGTAECIADKTREIMKEWDIPPSKLFGLGSDGASVMTGNRSGVGVRLKMDNSYLIHVHCIAHRVALASQDAAKLSKHVAEYRSTLNEIYKLYEYSATRYERLRDLSKVLDDAEFSSVKQPSTVRWLSLGRAVKSVKLNWPALVMEIEEEAADRKNNICVNLNKKLKTYNFIEMTYMLSDVLPIMEKLVTVFQKDCINLAMIRPMVNSTIECLEQLLTETGENEEFLKTEIAEGTFRGIKLTYADQRSVQAFSVKRTQFIEELINSLKKRFPDDALNVLYSLDEVLNPTRYPKERKELAEYGRESLDVLLEHYGTLIGPDNNDVTPVIDSERTKRDFPQFKCVLAGIGLTTFEKTCEVIIKEYSDIFPDFALLAEISLIIPVTSVPAERGFSLQNRIHTNSRNRLSQKRLNNLMMLNWHDSELNESDVTNAVKIFRSKKNRMI